MRPLFIVGLLLLIIGVASFFVAIPTRERHGVEVGGADVGITTTESRRTSPVIGGLLCAVGAVMMIASSRRR